MGTRFFNKRTTLPFNRFILLFSLFIISSQAALAARYAYIPILREAGIVAVVNTSTVEVVTNINVYNPTAVAINSDGSKVYVTQRFPEGQEGSIAIIDAHTNTVLDTKIEDIGLSQPASLIYHPTTNALFVTHNLGVTKVQLDETGLPTGETTLSAADFNSGEINYIGNYILSTGTKYNSLGKAEDAGITLTSAIEGNLIGDFSFENIGTIGISVDRQNSVAYVSNRSNDTIQKVEIINNEVIVKETITLDTGSAPFGIAYDQDYERLYVAKTASLGGFTNEPTGGATGLSSIELGHEERTVDEYQLAGLDSQYSYGILPLVVNYDAEDNTLYTIKSLYGSVSAGTYLSVVTNGLSGLETDGEEHVFIDGRGRPDFAGNFVGPECSLCPTGIETNQTTTRERRSSLNLISILTLAGILILARRFANRKKTHHIRS